MNKISDLQRKEINIAIVGPVSAGKSTLMNTLFTNQYSDMKIKRTTMTPQVYFEVNEELNMTTLSHKIKEQNREINQNLIQKSENNETILYSDIAESKYFIPRVHKLIEMPPDVYLTIYDIPGLNDSKTKNIYFQYMSNNFYKFDLIIFVIDINSALNTSDEIDILRNIIENSKNNFDNYDTENKVIILANKCDNLILDKDGTLLMEEEYQEMFNQIKTIVNTEVNKVFPQLQYSILPISCEDSYIYRMYDRDPDMDLDLRYVNKFGYDQCGRATWNKLSEDVRKSKIKKLMSEIDIDEVLKLSGFLDFKNVLNEYLNTDSQIKYLANHVYYVMSRLKGYDKLDIGDDIDKFRVLKSKIEEIYNIYTFSKRVNTTILQDLKKFLFNTEISNNNIDEYQYISDIQEWLDMHDVQSKYDEGGIVAFYNKYLNDYLCKHFKNVIDIEISNINENTIEQIYKIKNNIDIVVKYFPDLIIGKYILSRVNRAINQYYIENIEDENTSIKTGIKYLYDLACNNFEIKYGLISSLLCRDGITNVNAKQIVDYLNTLKSHKLIKKTELINLSKQILLSIYEHILNGNVIGYISDDAISKYVYLADNYWSNWDVKEVLIDDQIYQNILDIKFLAKQMMIKRILHNVCDQHNYNPGEIGNYMCNNPLVLEEYLTKVIFDGDIETADTFEIDETDSSFLSDSSSDDDLDDVNDVFDEKLEKVYKRASKCVSKSLPKSVKRDVWKHYVGESIGMCKCFCCKKKDINAFEFHVGHVESKKNGGSNEIVNLRPICALCNSSMNTKNMRIFMEENCYGTLE